MISVEKRVYKTYFFVSLIIFVFIFLLELLFKHYSFKYALGYLIGAITSALCFLLSIRAVDRMDPYRKGKSKSIILGTYFIKLIIYAFVLVSVHLYIKEWAIFTCFFGFLSIRISIHIWFNIIEPVLDKKRSIEKLNLNLEIKSKLKSNNIYTFLDLRNSQKVFLLSFLDEFEYIQLHNALREYGLFVKGELEVIKEDETSDDSDDNS